MSDPSCCATWELDSTVSVGDLEAQLDGRELSALEERVKSELEKWENKGGDAALPRKVAAFRDRDDNRKELLEEEKRKPCHQQKLPEERTQELARRVLPHPYNEVKNLLWIEKNVVHRKALEDWERKGKLLTAKVERKTIRSSNLKNEVYQLIGFFSVFQGVVLTAVSQSNLLHCNNLWCPIVLSGLASIVTLAGVRQKLDHISDLDKLILAEEKSLREVVDRQQKIRRLGEKFRFFEYCEDAIDPIEVEQEKDSWYSFLVHIIYPNKYTFRVQLALFLFMVAFALSHWRILCHSDPAPYPK